MAEQEVFIDREHVNRGVILYQLVDMEIARGAAVRGDQLFVQTMYALDSLARLNSDKVGINPNREGELVLWRQWSDPGILARSASRLVVALATVSAVPTESIDSILEIIMKNRRKRYG